MAIFNFPRLGKNSSALGSFNCIFENKSLKALFELNIKKLKILKLSPDSRYLQKLTLKFSEVRWMSLMKSTIIRTLILTSASKSYESEMIS